MTRLLLLICALSSALILSAQPQSFSNLNDVTTQGFDQERLGTLDQWLQSLIDDEIVPNAVTFVVRNGEVIHHKAFGYHNLETKAPVKTDAIFRIASQTKALVTVGLMMLHEEGHFLLDDPIAKYIPAFAEMQVIASFDEDTQETTYVPAVRPITIRHLLSHSAGIPYGHPAIDQEAAWEVPLFSSLEDIRLADAVDIMAKRPLVHQPGENFTYGLNTDILGRLIEVLSGQSLDTYLQEQLFTPLGMTDSHFYLPTSKHHRLVELYSKKTATAPLTLHEDETHRNFAIAGAQRYLSGGAGSVGTITDYGKFLQMLLNGGRFNNHQFLSPKTIELMLRNQIGASEVWDRKDKFGLGFQLITPGSHYGDQASPGSFTWGGLYLSEYTVDPTEELILIIYTNTHPIPQYGEIVRKFRTLVYAAMLD